MLTADLDILEQQARDARSLTVADAYYSVLVPGGALLELVRTQRALELLRASSAYQALVSTLRTDRDDWAYDERTGQEDYPGEAKARREAFEQLLLLLEEAP
jgi:hypothetical protein